MTNHLFCFGLGYSALTIADQLLNEGWRVSGTSRKTDNFAHLKSMGITPYLFDSDLPLDNIWDMDSVTHILVSIPPEKDGDIVLNHHLDDLKNISGLQWVGYLSTTGVYGDASGGWVDEESPLNPPNDRSIFRMEAENSWLQTGLPVNIFRLSGIYGKGRSAFDALKNGTARRINKPGQVFSRIHVEDIAQIVIASINSPSVGQIYNCADDMPAPQEEVVAYAAELVGIIPPPLVDFDKAELSPMAKSFYGSNRRVSNKKIKEQLGITLKYPDYKAGLNSIKNS